MKKTIFTLTFICLIYFMFSCKTKKLPFINTENVYRSELKMDDYWYYLKFYKDSTVISVSSSGKPKHLKKWFNRNLEQVPIGNYTIKKDSIFFSTTNYDGTVNYKGRIIAKKIHMYIESDINEYKSLRVYKLKN